MNQEFASKKNKDSEKIKLLTKRLQKTQEKEQIHKKKNSDLENRIKDQERII